LVIVGLGYLAFTMFVPIRQQPAWVTDARLLPLMQSSSEILVSLVPDRDHADFLSTPQLGPNKDALGDLIRKQNQEANSVSPATKDNGAAPPKKAGKTYGAKARQALDSLLETTGTSGK
jgi:membrane protein required for colicin V production